VGDVVILTGRLKTDTGPNTHFLAKIRCPRNPVAEKHDYTGNSRFLDKDLTDFHAVCTSRFGIQIRIDRYQERKKRSTITSEKRLDSRSYAKTRQYTTTATAAT